MNYLSLSAICKGEEPYILDWLKYHDALGVDHFYLYDNSDDSEEFKKIICSSDFIDKITYTRWPGVAMQSQAMTHCLQTYRKDSRWIGWIDVDEYIVPVSKDSIPEILHDFEIYPALGIHWKLFGSNGEEYYKPVPVVERFTKCANEVDRHIKSICDPEHTLSWVTVHKWRHDSGKAVDENFKGIEELDSRPEPATANKIYIAHYVTKSLEECTERRNRLRADIPEKHSMPEFFRAHDRNEVEDLRPLELWKKYVSK